MQQSSVSHSDAVKQDVLSLWYFITTSSVQLANAATLAAMNIDLVRTWPNLPVSVPSHYLADAANPNSSLGIALRAVDGPWSTIPSTPAWDSAVAPLLPPGLSAQAIEAASDQIWMLTVTSAGYYSGANIQSPSPLQASIGIVASTPAPDASQIAPLLGATNPPSFDTTRGQFGSLQQAAGVLDWTQAGCHPTGPEVTSLFAIQNLQLVTTA